MLDEENTTLNNVVRDPRGVDDLSDSNPKLVAEMINISVGIIGSLDIDSHDENILERLKTLGYLN